MSPLHMKLSWYDPHLFLNVFPECQMSSEDREHSWVTCSVFSGSLPEWVVNRVSQFVAPKVNQIRMDSWWTDSLSSSQFGQWTCLGVSLVSVLLGHEEDLQGVCEVSGVEAEAQPGAEALDVPGAEHAAVRARVRARAAARGLAGQHRREQRARGEDTQRGRGHLTDSQRTHNRLLFVCCFV